MTVGYRLVHSASNELEDHSYCSGQTDHQVSKYTHLINEE